VASVTSLHATIGRVSKFHIESHRAIQQHWRKTPLAKEGESQLLLDSVLMGIVGGFAALLFGWMLRVCDKVFLVWIAGYQHPALASEGGALQQVIGPHGLWPVIPVIVVGGLISGFLVYTWAPEAEGHGTDTAVKSYHRAGGFIRARVAPLKMVASAITIGSGGSAGREGPTALIGAGFGAVYATLRHRSDEERRLLVVIGMGAALSAIFRSPIGTALFAIEVLYGSLEFEGSALLYSLIASMVAYAIEGSFVGWKPLFQVPQSLPTPSPPDYVWYAALGVASGLLATLLPFSFYKLRDAFRLLPVSNKLKPAIGALGVGLLALEFPQILGGGYGWIQEAINGNLALQLLLILVFVKMAAFALTVASGGSGGVFAPNLYVGAMLGGAIAVIFHQPPQDFAVVGMAAVFGGAARVPFATLVMVMEMTGGYRLLGAAALAVLISYLVQTRLSSFLNLKYQSMYEAQVPGRAQSPAHYAEYLRVGLNLLGKDKVPESERLAHLNVMSLLRSGVSVDLPEGRQIRGCEVGPLSRYIGQQVRKCSEEAGEENVDIVVIMRNQDVLLPNPESILKPGDRMLAVVSPEGRGWLDEHFAPLRPEKSSEQEG
jgi:chloride channel protein, CIC family